MQSDSKYERVVKLWISLWEMVLQEKRHLETVMTILQKIIYEEKGFPQFKNWSAICELGRMNHLAMLTVATVDLSQRDLIVEGIIAAFPQCFSYEEVVGPYPLSLIRQKAGERARQQGSTHGEDFPISYDGVPDHIPVQGFFFEQDPVVIPAGNMVLLPENINHKTPQGGTVMWEEKEFVVLENNDSCEELWVAPAECIALDL